MDPAPGRAARPNNKMPHPWPNKCLSQYQSVQCSDPICSLNNTAGMATLPFPICQPSTQILMQTWQPPTSTHPRARVTKTGRRVPAHTPSKPSTNAQHHPTHTMTTSYHLSATRCPPELNHLHFRWCTVCRA